MRRKLRLLRLIFFFLLLLFVVTLSLAFLLPKNTAKTEKATPTSVEEPTGQTFLLIGTDAVSHSADIILLVRIEGESGGESVRFLQLPRDTLTSQCGKLNAVFAAACNRALGNNESEKAAEKKGAEALSAFLSRALGLSFDGYAVLTLSALCEIVDSIGGVPLTLPQALSYHDPAQNLHIELAAGYHLLDGQSACGFVRCRNAYLSADYGRMDAQKLFITAFMKKVKNDLSLSQLFSLAKTAFGKVVTDLSFGQTLFLGKRLLSEDLSAFSFATVKGFTLKKNGALYEVLPQETLTEGALWLGGSPEAGAMKNAFCQNDPEVLALYSRQALYPLSPISGAELDESGLHIP